MTAFWLGILTSISPCPLATNVAALAYVSRQGTQNGRVRAVLFAGLLYGAGRMFAYVLLAFLLVSSVLASPSASFFLQKYMHLFLGPLLILVGMILLELISPPLPSLSSGRLQRRLGGAGVAGAFPLGFIFALTFCPVSAALYFGSLIPLALKQHSSIGLPSIYGFATALPVLAAGVTLIFGTQAVGRFFNRVTAADKSIRIVTGGAIVLIGVYLCLRDIFKVI